MKITGRSTAFIIDVFYAYLGPETASSFSKCPQLITICVTKLFENEEFRAMERDAFKDTGGRWDSTHRAIMMRV